MLLPSEPPSMKTYRVSRVVNTPRNTSAALRRSEMIAPQRRALLRRRRSDAFFRLRSQPIALAIAKGVAKTPDSPKIQARRCMVSHRRWCIHPTTRAPMEVCGPAHIPMQPHRRLNSSAPHQYTVIPREAIRERERAYTASSSTCVRARSNTISSAWETAPS